MLKYKFNLLIAGLLMPDEVSLDSKYLATFIARSFFHWIVMVLPVMDHKHSKLFVILPSLFWNKLFANIAKRFFHVFQSMGKCIGFSWNV